MNLDVVESRGGRQGKGQTIMIEHKGRLFKFFYSIDESYHWQSRAYLEIMSTKNEFEHLTSVNVWDFTTKDGEYVEQDDLIDYVKTLVIKFTKYTKATNKDPWSEIEVKKK